MADDKLNTGPEKSEGISPPEHSEQKTSPAAEHTEESPPQPAPGEVVVDFDKINELMAQKRAAAREAMEKEEASAPTQEKKALSADKPPKEQTGPTVEKKSKAAEPRTGRPSKVDKAAREEAPPSVRDKVSRGKKADKDKETGSGSAPASKSAKTAKPGKAAPVKEAAVPPPEIKLPPTPEVPPRPVEEGKIVYLKMSELHPFHTFREHPYKVQDDKAMDDLVGTIKEHGIMTPATVRPEKDGKGYEIIAGHRRHHGGARAGLEEMPCIVREMTDLEAVREMRNSNKQRGDPLPSELAKLLDLEVEAIKRQGARPKNEKEAEALGKLSVEIVGKEHDMNYKKVMRYIRLNSLVPELLDKEGKLNGDVIDGILSEEKKEDRGVIISTAELSKYFGKEVTPAKMKEQIMALLDEWKEKQPPELAKPDKKKDLEK